MAGAYFSKFPIVTYSGVSVRNITLRANFIASFKNNASNFYPYTLKDGETADALAYDYYGDPNYVWVIYMANNIIDPYYDWPLSSTQLDKFVANKYGSVAEAQSQILYYKKLPVDYYVNKVTNEYILASSYNPAVNGYGWSKITIDDDITIANATNSLDPAIWAPVDAYTYEIENNNNKKNISLLSSKFITEINSRMLGILNA